MAGVIIAHASIDERGKIKGGKAGDQTGKEVCTRSWYNKPWSCIIRFKDEKQAEKLAYAMKAAANNPCIGYNQNRRNTALQIASHAGYDPARIKQDCETDCSALVSLACIYAGIPERIMTPSGNSCTTSNLKYVLLSTGLVKVFTTIDYTQSPNKLKVGDILLAEGHHVAVVVETSGATVTTEKGTLTNIAEEVISGKWGIGEKRISALHNAGYNPAEVQNEVNKILKEKS